MIFCGETHMRVKLIVAYDGTAYSGFQSQNNARAIQDVLEDALKALFKEKIKTIGASRTDAGVHARGNVAVFDVETKIEVSKIAYALNTYLPEDIKIMESTRCAHDFHPRYCDSRKTYIYRIFNAKINDPTRRLYTHHFYYPLNGDKMNEAAAMLVGEHDFASFCAAGYSGNSTVRTIYESCVERNGDEISYTVTGSGFLYNMVRIIAGTLIDIGNGRKEPWEMQEILKGKDRALAGDTAPTKGLMLMNIEYL